MRHDSTDHDGAPQRMRRIKYFFRRYWADLLTGITTLGGAWAVYRWAESPRLQLLASITITVLGTTIIVLLRTRETDFHFEPLSGRREKDRWLGHGTFEYMRVDRCFRITASDSGFILNRALTWSDYALQFDFKIHRSCLGVIVRAVDLSDLVMLQIVENGIRPHIRVNGAWKAWEVAEAGLPHERKLNLQQWHHCRVVLDKDQIRIRIARRGEQVCDLAWLIPRGTVHFLLQDGGPYAGGAYESAKTIPFAITLEYGTIGFRNDGDEEALVKNVLLERLRS